MDTDRILTEFFARRTAGQFNRHLSSVDFGLIHHIIRQRKFATVESLLRFCDDPRNLSSFLPDPRDQAIFSRRLVEGISEFRQAGVGTDAPSARSAG